ncbi:quinon protein alcohol dehydrogenase-like superfamily [Polychytrium aggregatum]|uniref:quinon protein alcohol dehydrogenase-like superfamily n=1 Tax=Polychytrium aggregatum TaxID=110093 RepID=UPI0022FF3F76|nr:quinon protein alcohol dehydrogenase-like superfamily [Polychytrium aggregatum]KAI9204786.1 quinon protein alcohol dehydrogenase-like superfamily [Polychytrium aggregatum]
MSESSKPTPVLVFQGHEKSVSSLLYHNGRLYSSSKDGTIKEWDIDTAECLRTLSGHTRWVRNINVGREHLYSASWDDTIREWNLETGLCQRVFEKHHDLGINAVVFDEETGRMYSGSDDKTIVVYDTIVGEAVDRLEGFSGSVTCLALYPSLERAEDGLLISGSSDGSINMWDLQSGECLESIPAHAAEVTSLVIIHGRLYSGGNDKVINEWDISTSSRLRSFRGHSGYISSLCADIDTLNDGSIRLFSGSWDGTVRAWDLVSGRCVGVLRAHTRSVNSLCLRADSNLLYTGSADGVIKAWDLDFPESADPQNAFAAAKSPVMVVPTGNHYPVHSPMAYPHFQPVPPMYHAPYYNAPMPPPPNAYIPHHRPPPSPYTNQNGGYGHNRPKGKHGGGPSRHNGAPTVCTFWLRGNCKFGDDCRNLHEQISDPSGC